LRQSSDVYQQCGLRSPHSLTIGVPDFKLTLHSVQANSSEKSLLQQNSVAKIMQLLFSSPAHTVL
jgi:hypothetical protein